jgi:hypothetical protein
LAAPGGEALLGDGDLEVLGHLVLVDAGTDFEADLGLAAQGTALEPGRLGDAREGARSVAARSSSRLRARSATRAALPQTTRRSPGKAGAVISARSRSSKSSSWSWPSATRAWIWGALSAVIQSSPASFKSQAMRASVIMPRSPTSATRCMPKRPLSFSTWAESVEGSPISPEKASMAIGQPWRSQINP